MTEGDAKAIACGGVAGAEAEWMVVALDEYSVPLYFDYI